MISELICSRWIGVCGSPSFLSPPVSFLFPFFLFLSIPSSPSLHLILGISHPYPFHFRITIDGHFPSCFHYWPSNPFSFSLCCSLCWTRLRVIPWSHFFFFLSSLSLRLSFLSPIQKYRVEEPPFFSRDFCRFFFSLLACQLA